MKIRRMMMMMMIASLPLALGAEAAGPRMSASTRTLTLTTSVAPYQKGDFYANEDGTQPRTNWSFSADSVTSTGYFILESNIGQEMKLEAKLPVLQVEGGTATMPYTTEVRLIESDDGAFALNETGSLSLKNSDAYQQFGTVNAQGRSRGIYAFTFSIDPDLFVTSQEGLYKATVEVQMVKE